MLIVESTRSTIAAVVYLFSQSDGLNRWTQHSQRKLRLVLTSGL